MNGIQEVGGSTPPGSTKHKSLIHLRNIATTRAQPAQAAVTPAGAGLMLFTGARPNELAQLQVEDLPPDFNGRPHISVLREEGTDKKADELERGFVGDDEGDAAVMPPPTVKSAPDGRSVKTLAGKRLIPVHKELIALGFVEFWKRRASGAKPKTLIFGDIDKEPAKNANFYTTMSKRHNRLLEKHCHVNERQDMYSLRHNFNDACKAAEARREMMAETRMKFMGHRLPGMDGIYGNPLPREDESPTIDSIGL